MPVILLKLGLTSCQFNDKHYCNQKRSRQQSSQNNFWCWNKHALVQIHRLPIAQGDPKSKARVR